MTYTIGTKRGKTNNEEQGFEMEDEKYYLNNKIYNITKSDKLYEYTQREATGKLFMGKYPMMREVEIRIYSSVKGNLFQTITKDGRISIKDINDEGFKEILLRENALDILEKLYPLSYKKLEEY